MDGDHRDSEQPGDSAKCLVEGRGEQATVRKARRALVVLGHLQLGVDRAALSCRQGQVQAGGMVGTAAEALAVVTAQRGAGRRGVSMAHRRYGVARRLDRTPAGRLLGHGRTLPARQPSSSATLGMCPPPTPSSFRERLTTPWWAWVVACFWALTLAIAYGYAIATPIGVVVGVAAFALASLGLAQVATVVTVSEAGLTAGRAMSAIGGDRRGQGAGRRRGQAPARHGCGLAGVRPAARLGTDGGHGRRRRPAGPDPLLVRVEPDAASSWRPRCSAPLQTPSTNAPAADVTGSASSPSLEEGT